MAFADELLELARDLTKSHALELRQAALRRSVSTAYYALFHLLVSEATLNWGRPELRPAMGRLFDHGAMRSASDSQVSQLNKGLKSGSSAGPERAASQHLRKVAETFGDVQRLRQEADYNTATEWTMKAAEEQIRKVTEAFESWKIIR